MRKLKPKPKPKPKRRHEARAIVGTTVNMTEAALVKLLDAFLSNKFDAYEYSVKPFTKWAARIRGVGNLDPSRARSATDQHK